MVRKGTTVGILLDFKGDTHHYLLFKASSYWFIFAAVLIERYGNKSSRHYPFHIKLGVDFETY